MKIKTFLDPGYKHVLVPTFIFNPLLGENPHSITLLVDTGASTTTILQGDALILGIGFSKLKKERELVTGLSGKKGVYKLEDVTLAFQLDSSPSDLIYAKLEKIHVVKPTKKTKPYPLSVMGMDLLQRLHFDYCNPKVSLTCKIKMIKGVRFIQ